jgi:hypothetical protein
VNFATGPAHVVAFAGDPARAFLYLAYGGWNECPPPHVQTRVWQHCANTIGAEPAVLDEASVYGLATRPPTTREDLVRFVSEAMIYDGDLAIEGVLPLLGQQFRNASLDFWWD